jgi:hypothetical protein
MEDAGVLDIVGDDGAPTPDDCTSVRCLPGTIFHACTCVPIPRSEPAFDTVRTSCAQISTATTTRTPDDDYCVDGAPDQAPDLSCITSPRAPVASRLVTVYGVVDVFGNGPSADAVTVTIYEYGADGMLGAMVGSATASGADSCAETEELIRNGMPTGETRQLGAFAIPNVRTETNLIVVTSGDASTWKTLYTYNFYILDEEVESGAPPAGACAGAPTGDRYPYRARVLSVADYRTIPLTAGIAGGIAAGRGAIAGEVHDCGDVRLEFATVGVSPVPAATPYFNDDADNPLPDISRSEGTGLLGLYAGLDLPAGPVRVSALGRVGGQVHSLGWFTARIFPDSVTAVSLRGRRPQAPMTP